MQAGRCTSAFALVRASLSPKIFSSIGQKTILHSTLQMLRKKCKSVGEGGWCSFQQATAGRYSLFVLPCMRKLESTPPGSAVPPAVPKWGGLLGGEGGYLRPPRHPPAPLQLSPVCRAVHTCPQFCQNSAAAERELSKPPM